MGKVGSNFTICSKILVNCQNVCTRNWSRNLFCEKWRGMQKSIWGAKRRFSSKPGLRDAPPKYLLFSMPPPPGGVPFYPPQNPQKHPPGPPQLPLWFWGRNWCFSGFSGHPAKTPKIDSFGFSPKMSFFRFLRTGSDCVAYYFFR